jgi:undecaprenyl pyrophosphate phosphatase UppP
MLTFFQCFYINLPIGAVAAVVIFFLFVMPEDARPAQATSREKLLQLDLIGAALMMGLIIACILALQYAGQTHPWNSSVVISLLVGFVAILAVFVAWEIFQKERAMIVPRLVCRVSIPVVLTCG